MDLKERGDISYTFHVWSLVFIKVIINKIIKISRQPGTCGSTNFFFVIFMHNCDLGQSCRLKISLKVSSSWCISKGRRNINKRRNSSNLQNKQKEKEPLLIFQVLSCGD